LPARLHWREELPRLSLLNRQIMQVHSLFIAILLLLVGLLCVTSSTLLADTPLGRRLCWGLAAFWAARLLAQLFWYSPQLWRGKTFETAVHVVATLTWFYFSLVFVLAATGRG
jgi:hypothetical protein